MKYLMHVSFFSFFVLVLLGVLTSCSTLPRYNENDVNEAIKLSFVAGFKDGSEVGCKELMFIIGGNNPKMCEKISEAQSEEIKQKVMEVEL